MARRRRKSHYYPYETLGVRPHRPTQRTALQRPPLPQKPVSRRARAVVSQTKQPARPPARTVGVRAKAALPGLRNNPKIKKALIKHRRIDYPRLKNLKLRQRCIDRIRNEGRSRFQKMKNRIAGSGAGFKKHRRQTDLERELNLLERIERECK